ncbi:MAG TPA: CDP-diacylglycerol diphosphatase, partial [Candidatus Eremiobacteraceae bacterium]|nr:CDP-diacylglycerol diphosphatase [Candidatus Eremiobacteraceae bacterium]
MAEQRRPWWWGRRAARISIVAVVVAVIAVAVILAVRAAENPDALWIVVRSCVAQREAHRASPACVAVSLKDRVAFIKSPEGRYQYLAIPTIEVTGIEDPQILEPSFPNYWELAWEGAHVFLPPQIARRRDR